MGESVHGTVGLGDGQFAFEGGGQVGEGEEGGGGEVADGCFCCIGGGVDEGVEIGEEGGVGGWVGGFVWEAGEGEGRGLVTWFVCKVMGCILWVLVDFWVCFFARFVEGGLKGVGWLPL